MAAAIDNFQLMEVDNKMAILGDMRELGDASAVEHQKVVDLLKATDIRNVWLVGEELVRHRLLSVSSMMSRRSRLRLLLTVQKTITS